MNVLYLYDFTASLKSVCIFIRNRKKLEKETCCKVLFFWKKYVSYSPYIVSYLWIMNVFAVVFIMINMFTIIKYKFNARSSMIHNTFKIFKNILKIILLLFLNIS